MRIRTFIFCSVRRLVLLSKMSRPRPKLAQSPIQCVVGSLAPDLYRPRRTIVRFARRLAGASITHL